MESEKIPAESEGLAIACPFSLTVTWHPDSTEESRASALEMINDMTKSLVEAYQKDPESIMHTSMDAITIGRVV